MYSNMSLEQAELFAAILTKKKKSEKFAIQLLLWDLNLYCSNTGTILKFWLYQNSEVVMELMKIVL